MNAAHLWSFKRQFVFLISVLRVLQNILLGIRQAYSKRVSPHPPMYLRTLPKRKSMITCNSQGISKRKTSYSLKESCSVRPRRVSSSAIGTASLARSSTVIKRRTMKGTRTCIVSLEYSLKARRRSNLRARQPFFTHSRSYSLSTRCVSSTVATAMKEASGCNISRRRSDILQSRTFTTSKETSGKENSVRLSLRYTKNRRGRSLLKS